MHNKISRIKVETTYRASQVLLIMLILWGGVLTRARRLAEKANNDTRRDYQKNANPTGPADNPSRN